MHRLGSLDGFDRYTVGALTVHSGRLLRRGAIGRPTVASRQGRHGGCIGRAYAHGFRAEPPSEHRSEPHYGSCAKAGEASEHQIQPYSAPQRRQPWCPQCTLVRGIPAFANIRRKLTSVSKHTGESGYGTVTSATKRIPVWRGNDREPTHSYRTPPRAHRAGSLTGGGRYRAPSTRFTLRSDAANPRAEPVRRYPSRRPCAELRPPRNHQR